MSLRVAVPSAWLVEGRSIEIELPRNLTCARCSGGGCGACNNSGAITLRGRAELPEFVQVVLPLQRITEVSERSKAQDSDRKLVADSDSENPSPAGARPVTIRIPECGGLPDAANGAIVRGWLYLEVAIAERPSSSVRAIQNDESLSSSKVLRAEARPSLRNSIAEKLRAVAAVRSSRPPGLQEDEESEPPSSRVAPLGSTKPPMGRSKSPAAVADGELTASPTLERQARIVPTAIYVGLVVLALLGIIALLRF